MGNWMRPGGEVDRLFDRRNSGLVRQPSDFPGVPVFCRLRAAAIDAAADLVFAASDFSTLCRRQNPAALHSQSLFIRSPLWYN